MWNIWQFLGVSSFGMFQDQVNYGTGVQVATYNGPAWYIAAFMAFCCVFYAILMHSETLAVYVFCPVMFMMSNMWLNRWLDPETGAQITYGITEFLPQDVVRLWGPLALGIWGWYAIEALKNAKLTKKQENGLGVLFVALLAFVLFTSWYGYFGGMLNQDVLWMLVAGLAIALKDPVTKGLNDKLQNFPLSKHFADFSAGLYLVHAPLLTPVGSVLIERFGLTTAPWLFELCCIAGALFFMVCNTFLLKPAYGKLSKVLNARGPVIVDENTPRNFA